MFTEKALMGLAYLTLVALPSFAEDAADLVLRNGAFYPVSEPGRVEGSLVIREGRIVFLGPDAETQRFLGAQTEILELAGRTVTPGLIDAHSHLLSLSGGHLIGIGGGLSEIDLVGTSSYDEVVERVRAVAREVPAGEWILARGWDQNDWPDRRFPVHGPLSRAVPDHPVWITRIDGHAAVLNERAMRRLQIDGSVSDPPGGRILLLAAAFSEMELATRPACSSTRPWPPSESSFPIPRPRICVGAWLRRQSTALR